MTWIDNVRKMDLAGVPGDAGQVSNDIEEVFLWHFTEA